MMNFRGLDGRIKSIALAVLVLGVFFACTRASPLSPVNVTPDGVAIKGYDPLSYFTDKRPEQGIAKFEYLWNGAKWHFVSAAHRDLFRTDPEKYAPRYGGYCAYAVSQGKTADIDPEAWSVFEGRLYLNLNKEVRGLWEKDMREYIRKADENWPRMLGKKHILE
jgi:YHS domain-containing protein